jgi:uncharacterized protein (UPF0147 family)
MLLRYWEDNNPTHQRTGIYTIKPQENFDDPEVQTSASASILEDYALGGGRRGFTANHHSKLGSGA